MALLTFASSSETHKIHQPTHHTKRKHHHQQKTNPNPNPKPIPKSNPKPKPKSKSKPKPNKPEPKQQNQSSSSSSSSWDQFKNLLTCKQMDVVGSTKVNNDPVNNKNPNNNNNNNNSKLSSCSSICSFRDVVHGNTRVVHRADNSPESSTTTSTNVGLDFGLLTNRKKQQMSHDQIMGRRHHGSSSNSSKTLTSAGSVRSNSSIVHGSTTYTSCSSRGMQFRKLSGCYECHAIVDPSRYTIPRSTICVCSQCGEVFPKMESLEHHQAVRHAVSELGSDDSGRNIVEIIFKSSWLKKDHPIFTIERILKVHNTSRTIQRFEDCRDAVKSRATATTTASRRAADGNELLRFHCTTLACSLGARNSSTLCSAIPGCGVCTVIRYGFQNPKCGGIIGAGGDGGAKSGVRTSASSGRAHDCLGVDPHGRRAMLVCRVIAGKVKRVTDGASPDEDGPYDSVAGYAGLYSNLEELYVYNPRAILPCFVVIYKALES